MTRRPSRSAIRWRVLILRQRSAVFTVPGYKPTNRDAVSLSVAGGGAGNVIATGGLATTLAQANVTYYVCSASATAETFSLTTNKAAGSDYPVATLQVQGGIYTTGTSFVHLLSNQVDGTTIPFKPGNTVLIYNGGLNTGLNNSGSPGMNLLGSPDLNRLRWLPARTAPRLGRPVGLSSQRCQARRFRSCSRWATIGSRRLDRPALWSCFRIDF